MSTVTLRPIIALPDDHTLLRAVRRALEEVSQGPWNDLTQDAIASAIAKELKGNTNTFCYSGKPTRVPNACAGSEWLVDFCALLYAEPAGTSRFVAQAAIIGETEWGPDGEIDADFEKLLIVDSIVCFLVFGAMSDREANRKLDRYEDIVTRKKAYAAVRLARLPSFLLACYVEPASSTARPLRPIFREIPFEDRRQLQ